MIGRTPEEIEKKFIRLRDEWEKGTHHESSPTRRAMHPAYQKIIGMGPDVLPLLLKDMEVNFDHWSWALQAITEECPVTEEIRGYVELMAKAWLDLAKERGWNSKT